VIIRSGLHFKSSSWVSAISTADTTLLGFIFKTFYFGVVCNGAHTPLSIPPSRLLYSDIDLAPGGRHGTENNPVQTSLRDGLCDGGDHPSDHDVRWALGFWKRLHHANSVKGNDLPPSIPECFLKVWRSEYDRGPDIRLGVGARNSNLPLTLEYPMGTVNGGRCVLDQIRPGNPPTNQISSASKLGPSCRKAPQRTTERGLLALRGRGQNSPASYWMASQNPCGSEPASPPGCRVVAQAPVAARHIRSQSLNPRRSSPQRRLSLRGQTLSRKLCR
jgi:hypothetical protein